MSLTSCCSYKDDMYVVMTAKWKEAWYHSQANDNRVECETDENEIYYLQTVPQ